MKISTKVLLGLSMLLAPFAANAQSDTEKGKTFFPYGYVQVQGGAQKLFTPGCFEHLLSPVLGLNVGYNFSSVVGARIGVTATEMLNTTCIKFGDNDMSYINTNVDVLLNLSNLFSKNRNNRFNVYFLGGIGMNYSWDKYWAPNNLNETWGHNLRVGAIAEYKLAKALSVSLEADLDNMSDKFNGKMSNSDDWMGSLKVGLAYNFGYSKTPDYVEPVPAKPLSLYEQMQQGVQSRINNWMKRLDGESKEAYQLRTNSDSIASLRLQFEKEVSTEMAGDKIGESQVTLGKYNTGKELLTVDFNTMPSITLNVPKADVTAFKSADDMKFSNTVYGLNKNDKFEVLYTEVLNGNNSKTYVYNNLEGKDVNLINTAEGFVPLSVVHENIANTMRLEKIKTDAVQQAMDEDILSDNTTISVATEVVSADNNKIDYKISYKYTVKDGFSATDDFAPGKYNAEGSKASVAMMKIIKKAFETDFAQYVKAGKACKISFTGTADAMPIHGVISYNGKYGDIKNQDVNVNGKNQKITVTKKDGITNNEQLSLVRAVSVKDYIYKNLKGLDKMKTTNEYNIEVSPEVGSEHRRVKVDFLFYDAF